MRRYVLGTGWGEEEVRPDFFSFRLRWFSKIPAFLFFEVSKFCQLNIFKKLSIKFFCQDFRRCLTRKTP
jgi:hypothetical protein